jgi:hypothetical protein
VKPNQRQEEGHSTHGLALCDLDHTLVPLDSDQEWNRFLVTATNAFLTQPIARATGSTPFWQLILRLMVMHRTGVKQVHVRVCQASGKARLFIPKRGSLR